MYRNFPVLHDFRNFVLEFAQLVNTVSGFRQVVDMPVFLERQQGVRILFSRFVVNYNDVEAWPREEMGSLPRKRNLSSGFSPT